MSEIHERLATTFDYLRVRGVVHTQVEVNRQILDYVFFTNDKRESPRALAVGVCQHNRG